MTIATLIKTRREALGLTQMELGQRLGIHGQSISNVEGGRAEFPLHHSKTIAKALKIEPKVWNKLVLGLFKDKASEFFVGR